MDHTLPCEHCWNFFKHNSCTAASHGECDCPRCQGFCECTNPQVDTPLMSPPPCGNSAGGSVSGTSPALFDTRTLAQTINNLFGRHFQRDPIDDDYDNRGEREYRLWRER